MSEATPDDAFEVALSSVDPAVRGGLRVLVADTAYVEPRVVSHVRD